MKHRGRAPQGKLQPKYCMKCQYQQYLLLSSMLKCLFTGSRWVFLHQWGQSKLHKLENVPAEALDCLCTDQMLVHRDILPSTVVSLSYLPLGLHSYINTNRNCIECSENLILAFIMADSAAANDRQRQEW